MTPNKIVPEIDANTTPLSLGRMTNGQHPIGELKTLLKETQGAVTAGAIVDKLQQLRQKHNAFVEDLTAQKNALAKQGSGSSGITSKSVDILIERAGMSAKKLDEALKAFSDSKPEGPLSGVVNTVLKAVGMCCSFHESRYLKEFGTSLEDLSDFSDYLKEITSPVRFADIYFDGNAALEDSSKSEWRDFLKGLEHQVQSNAVSKGQQQALIDLIKKVKAKKELPTWFALYFKKGSIDEVLESLRQLNEGSNKLPTPELLSKAAFPSILKTTLRSMTLTDIDTFGQVREIAGWPLSKLGGGEFRLVDLKTSESGVGVKYDIGPWGYDRPASAVQGGSQYMTPVLIPKLLLIMIKPAAR